MNTVSVTVPADMKAAVEAFIEEKQREARQTLEARYAPGTRVRVVAEGEISRLDMGDHTARVRSAAFLDRVSDWIHIESIEPIEAAPATKAASERPLAVGDEVYIKARVARATGTGRCEIEIDTPEVGWKRFGINGGGWTLRNEQLLRALPTQEASAAPSDVDAEVRRVYDGSPANKITAIKRLRELTGMGLKDAKDYVEALCEGATPTRYSEGDCVWVKATIRMRDNGDNTYRLSILDFTGTTEPVGIEDRAGERLWVRPELLRPRHD